MAKLVEVCGDYPGARAEYVPRAYKGEPDWRMALRLAEKVDCDGYTVAGRYYARLPGSCNS